MSRSLALAGLCLLLAVAPCLVAGIEESDVLNFALNLEYLEATFYKCALDGKPLPAGLRGGGPLPTGCRKAKNLDAEAKFLLAQLASDEIAHVKFLRTALGSAAVPQPAINIGTAFADAAAAAFNVSKLTPAFSPYKGSLPFLIGSFIFEDVGVTAYHGGLRALTTDAFRSAAEGIMAIEAYHAGAVRLALTNKKNMAAGYGATVKQVIKAIANLRDAADCTTDTEDAGLEDLAPADSNAIAYLRGVQGVLKIVYLGGTNKGGFFPNGMNGVIKTAC